MKSFIIPLAGFCSLLSITPGAFAQKSWSGTGGAGGDGSWVSGSFSPVGLPGSADQVHFYRSGTYTAATSNVAVNTGTSFSTGVARIGRGKTVNFTIGSGTSWTTAAIVAGDKNIASQTGTGAANVTITADPGAGVLKVTQFVVGLDDANPGVTGNSLTFTGEHLMVTVNAANTASIVGRNNGESLLRVMDGADVTLSGLVVGQTQNDNRVEVTGAGAKLTLSGVTPTGPVPSPIALGIGYVSASAAVNGGNSLYVANGGEVAITGTNSNHRTYVGNLLGQGGNLLEVGSSGTFRTTGNVTVSGYSTTSGDRGANGIIIRNGGSFVMNDTAAKLIDVAGFLNVEAGGALSGNGGVSILSGGVLRAAGSGVDLQGVTQIQNGGAMEVGTSASVAEILTLNGNFTMQSGSELRFNLLDDGSFDQIFLASGASLLLNGSVVLELELASGYTPTAGTTFTLFTGETTGITGNFDISQYDPALWDFSAFNEAGGWQVTAIPEPSSVMLMVGAGALLFAAGRRKVNKI